MRSDDIIELVANPFDNEPGRYHEQFVSLVATTLDDYEIVELFRLCTTELALRICSDNASDEVLEYALRQVYRAAILSTKEGARNS